MSCKKRWFTSAPHVWGAWVLQNRKRGEIAPGAAPCDSSRPSASSKAVAASEEPPRALLDQPQRVLRGGAERARLRAPARSSAVTSAHAMTPW